MDDDRSAGGAPRLSTEEMRALSALTTGATDDVAAARLGMSKRTFRRRVHSAMLRLGAESRFQAGFRFALVDTGGQRDAQDDTTSADNRHHDDPVEEVDLDASGC